MMIAETRVAMYIMPCGYNTALCGFLMPQYILIFACNSFIHDVHINNNIRIKVVQDIGEFSTIGLFCWLGQYHK